MVDNPITIPDGETILGVPEHYRSAVIDAYFSVAATDRAVSVTQLKNEIGEFVDGLEARVVSIPSFAIDERPVTLEQFCEFVAQFDRGSHFTQLIDLDYWDAKLRSHPTDSPATDVTWTEAMLYCVFRGGYLPYYEQIVRCVRNGSECPDLERVDSCRDFPANRFLSVSDDDSFESWSGCRFLLNGCNEWTASPAQDMPLYRRDYTYICKEPDVLFPLLEPESGFAVSPSTSVFGASGNRYENLGFRCAYYI